jgi:hypothetical protein
MRVKALISRVLKPLDPGFTFDAQVMRRRGCGDEARPGRALRLRLQARLPSWNVGVVAPGVAARFPAPALGAVVVLARLVPDDRAFALQEALVGLWFGTRAPEPGCSE